MKIVIHLLLYFSSVSCTTLSIDKFLAAVGTRSAAFSRTRVGSVFKSQAAMLNVTAQSHLDHCSEFVTQLFNTKDQFGNPIRGIEAIANFTTIEDIFEYVLHDESVSFAMIFIVKGKLIRETLSQMDKQTEDIVETIAMEVFIVMAETQKMAEFRNYEMAWRKEDPSDPDSETIFFMNYTGTIPGKPADEAYIRKTLNRIKSRSMAWYAAIPAESKIELERKYCAMTLTEIFKEDPFVSRVIANFTKAKHYYLDEFMKTIQARGNFSEDRVLTVMYQEAVRLNVPLQSHIEKCDAVNARFASIDQSLKALNLLNRQRQLNISRNELLRTLKEDASSVYYEVTEVEYRTNETVPRLTAGTLSFINRTIEHSLEILLEAVNNPHENLTSWEVFEKMEPKVLADFKGLSNEDKRDFEREYCVRTSLRILADSDEMREMIGCVHSSTDCL